MKTIGNILSAGNSYSDQINDDRWREFSQRVRSSRNFCECCKRADVTLQVHHLFYDFERKLWEYSDGEVVVLCQACHHEIHEGLKVFRKHIFRHLNGRTIKVLNAALAVGLTQYDSDLFIYALAEFATNKRLVENHARAWGERKEKPF